MGTSKNTNRVVSLLVISASLLLLVFVIVKNANMDGEAKKRNYQEALKELRDRYFIQIDAIEYPIGDFHFFNKSGMEVRVGDMAATATLGIYIDNLQCSSCWERDLLILDSLREQDKYHFRPIVLAKGFQPRELVAMSNRIKLPVYSIRGENAFLPPLTKFNLPFFFIITDECKLKSAFFPSEHLDKKYWEIYLDLVDEKCEAYKSGSLYKENVGKRADLHFHEEEIDLGEIGFRKKAVANYHFKNEGQEACEIYECSPSCSCVLIDSFSRIIKPGESGFVTATIVPTVKGEFSHSISVRTNAGSMPYSLILSGVCK